MKKICFFDIDGTILGPSRVITDKNKEALQAIRKNGHMSIVCTGRSPSSISREILDIGFDGIIASAGSFIYLNDKQIFEHEIETNTLLKIIYLFTKNNILFNLETKSAVYQSPGMLDFFLERDQERFKDNLELLRTREDRTLNDHRKPLSEFDGVIPVAKVGFIAKNKEDFERCIPFVEDEFNIVYFSKPEEPYLNGEIILKTHTKGDGVKFLTSYLKRPMSDTIAFGDSMNDFEMLQVADTCYVSELADDNLKAMANGLFAEPDHDGMYEILKKLELF